MIVSDIYDNEARKHSLGLTVAATKNYVTPSEVEGREKILAL
jgi:hypothetical protein